MIRTGVSALLFGLLVTLLALLVVSGFNRPRPHPEEQHPERIRPAPIVTAAPPPVRREAFDMSPEAASPVVPTPAPAALLPQTPLPPIADTHPALNLSAVLPGLPKGLPRLSVGASNPAPEAEQAAVPRRRPAPRYPPSAQRRGIEGHVVVRLRVDVSGRVTEAVVVDADPPGLFDESARQAALGYTFTPARSGGRAVPSTLEQRILFRLR